MAKFFRRGKSKLIACPSVANRAAPTRAELTAGLELGKVTEMTGFQLSNSPIATPEIDSAFTTQAPGEDTTADSALTFTDHDNVTSEAVRTALAKGTELVMVLMPYGDSPTKRAECWPVLSTGVNDNWDMGNSSATFRVGFAVHEEPEQDAVIPAAAP